MFFPPTFLTLILTLSITSLGAPLESRDFDYVASALKAHNVHRQNHSASDLVWDDTLANAAQEWAQVCTFAHNTTIGGGGYGQNIALGNSDTCISISISDQWYNNELGWYASLYGEAQPSMTDFEHWGHFSQVVWKGTTKVGCATVNCPDGVMGWPSTPWITVCDYGGPGEFWFSVGVDGLGMGADEGCVVGNYAGEYAGNVGEPMGMATVVGGEGM
ncbi:hypothetical protein M409DRAFT_36574 [Zasmidium cellare ATCC 36951]|uniref:SCP domain-containing protein n=1 Tax=Zasmidium cellare ATCC 36951 TaxID=1080233 RepID=A0A6A6CP47_ZASCE|nr:uncharacterized protein M409DRAFT_36574 [Zasmidium cellare ATCC 36951]KAF2167519.1 hypothetical protein M409DRAFT_36574 [Zasmidium cellare ATCC 36951]